MRRFRLIVAGFVGLLALIFVLQNTQVVSVRFIAWEMVLSSALLLALTLGAGFLLGYLVARLTRRR